MPAGTRAWSIFGSIGLTGLGKSVAQLRSFTAVGQEAALMMGGAGAAALAAGAAVTTATLALTGFAVEGARAGAQFEDAMAGSLAIMRNVSDVMRTDLELAARRAALVTTFSNKEAAESFFFLTSAGLDTAQSLAALPAVAQFAQAGLFNMAQATELLTDAQAALGLKTADAEENLLNMVRVSDVLTRANQIANATVEQFSLSLTTKTGARLKLLNKTVEEGVATLAAFADQGVKGALAGERLNIILRDLPEDAVRNAEAFRNWNIEVFDAQGNLKNMADIIQEFQNSLGGLSDAQKSAAFEQLGLNLRAQDGITLLFGLADRIRRYQNELENAGGATEEVATKQLDSLIKQAGLAAAKITDLSITLGAPLVGALRGAIDTTNEFLDKLIELRDFATGGEDGVNRLEGAVLSFIRALPGGAQTLTIIDTLEARRQLDELREELRNSPPFVFGVEFEPAIPTQARADLENMRQMFEGTMLDMTPDPPDPSPFNISRDLFAKEADDRIAEGERAQSERARQEEFLRRQTEIWARERREIELREAGNRNQELLALLRERLSEAQMFSDEWKGIMADILRVEANLHKERVKIAEEQRKLMEDLIRHQVAIGKISPDERIEQLTQKLENQNLTIRERIEAERELFRLQRDREALQQRVIDAERALAEQQRELALRTGDLDTLVVFRTMAAEIDILRMKVEQAKVSLETIPAATTAAFTARQELVTASQQLLDAENARIDLIEQATQREVGRARMVARVNKEAAVQILQDWIIALQQLDGISKEVMEALVATVSDAQIRIQGETKSRWEGVAEDFKRAGVQMGVNLVRGIIQGGKDGEDRLKNFFASLLDTLIAIGIKAFLFGSPSRVTRQWGRDIVEGLVLGLDDRSSAAVAQMSSLMESTKAAGAEVADAVGSMLDGVEIKNPLAGFEDQLHGVDTFAGRFAAISTGVMLSAMRLQSAGRKVSETEFSLPTTRAGIDTKAISGSIDVIESSVERLRGLAREDIDLGRVADSASESLRRAAEDLSRDATSRIRGVDERIQAALDRAAREREARQSSREEFFSRDTDSFRGFDFNRALRDSVDAIRVPSTTGFGAQLASGIGAGFERNIEVVRALMLSRAQSLVDSLRATTAGGFDLAAAGFRPVTSPPADLGAREAGVRVGGVRGLEEGVRLDFDPESLPPPLTPFEVARDVQWQRMLSTSMLTLEDNGFRFRDR